MRRFVLFVSVMLALTLPARADELNVAGRDRTYSVHRPSRLARTQAAPLVVVLHGGFGTGAQAEQSYHWDEHADSKGFVVAYPDGIRRSWNAGGGCCGPAFRDKVDDVGFINALIRTLSQTQDIDPKRIYLAGISNGAAMSYRYACEGDIAIAAIGSVSGTMPGGCAKPRSVSVIEIHGIGDRNIPFAGGVGTKGVSQIDWPSVQSSLEVFRRADRCGRVHTSTAGVVRTSVNHCADRSEVTLITISDAGHQWPGAKPAPSWARLLLDLDPPSGAMDATSVLWDFFERHPAH